MTSALCKAISICLLLLLLGCAKPEPVVQYIEVDIPVRYKLERPLRPVRTKQDTTPMYLLKLMEYTMKLETIIDENNKEW